MLDYTRTAISKTISDFKKFGYFFNISMQLIYIIYLIYTIIAESGIFAVNIILAAISLAYLVFYLVTYDENDKKSLKIFTKRSYKLFKLSVKAFTLGVMIYGIYAAAGYITPLSVILSALTVVTWFMQVIMELTLIFLQNQMNLFITAIEADIDEALKPVHAVGNFIDKVRRKAPEAPKEPSKNRLLLDRLVSERKAEKKRLKSERKAEKAAQKKTKKQEKRIAFKAKFDFRKETAEKSSASDTKAKEKIIEIIPKDTADK